MQFSDILKVNFFSGITELDKVCEGGDVGGCGGMLLALYYYIYYSMVQSLGSPKLA